jgi:hypothetical protein
MLGHAGEDGRHLRGSLAGAEDDFGHAGAKGAMMIELGKADVLEGQVAKAIEGGVDGGAAFAHFIEQGFDLRAIHQFPSFAVSLAA